MTGSAVPTEDTFSLLDGGEADAPAAGPGRPVLAGLNLTDLTPETERIVNAVFASYEADPTYREHLAPLYRGWNDHNRRYFDGRLALPHLGIGTTSPRRLSCCRPTTDYGGEISITLAARVVFATDRRLVRAPGEAGHRRFLDDLLLAETARQYVLEVLHADEDGYGGYGPLFCAEASRIGEAMGLGPVEPRRRGWRGTPQPVAAFWPWAFRPPGYYHGHVRFDHLQVAGLRPDRARHAAVLPGFPEYCLYLLATGQHARHTRLLGRVVDAAREARLPAVAQFERSPHDPSGMPVPGPIFHPEWLDWNSGCVRAIAAAVRDRRAFEVMPILADALEDAGCEDATILGHCRAGREHTGNCWVLRALSPDPETADLPPDGGDA